MNVNIRGVARDRLDQLLAAEAEAFRANNPKSQGLSERAANPQFFLQFIGLS